MKSKKQQSKNIEVLYQRMGSRWFAFYLIDDEVFVGSVSTDEVEAVEKTTSKPRERVRGSQKDRRLS